jgi:asparagine synthetase B (glutamine-hydrolysing)
MTEDPRELVNEVESLLADAVRLRLIADVPIGTMDDKTSGSALVA